MADKPVPIRRKGCKNVGWIKLASGEKVVVPLHVGEKCIFVTNKIFNIKNEKTKK